MPLKAHRSSVKDINKYRTTKQKLAFLSEEINHIYIKGDASVLNELTHCSFLRAWLQCQELDYASRIKVLMMVHRACHFDGSKKETFQFIQQLVSLKGNFIAFILATLASVNGSHSNYELVHIVKTVFDVIQFIFQHLPVSSLDFIDLVVPRLPAYLRDILDETKQELLSEINELLVQRIGVIELPSILDDSDVLSPPCDYRDIAILPGKLEISETEPFLRINIVEGPYRNVEHYLDIQFRLMREDMFCYLRECITEYQNVDWQGSRSSAFLKNGHVYFGMKVLEREYKNGIFFIATINTGKKINWSTTKKLKPSSLLCISHDKFESFAFVCIHSREPTEGISESCCLRFSAENDESFDYLDFFRSYDVIETTAFYESYKHVLKRLQLLNTENFPLPLPLLQFMECDKKPSYLEDTCVTYDLSNVVKEPEKLKKENKTQALISVETNESKYFDEHQQIAFQMALSNSVSLIQGPPGTGKTFLGLEIVKWLVKNASATMKAPILIICYTNHALDQFLEGALNFTEKVIRVGGQSKNDSLVPFHLNELVNASLGSSGAKEESRRIVHSVLKCPVLQRLRAYTESVKNEEKLLHHLELCLFQIDDNPIYSERVASLLWPEHFIHEILRSLNIFDIKNNDVYECLIVGIKYWLCISVCFLHVYEELHDFLFCVIKELINYIENSSGKMFRRCVNKAQKQCDVPEANVFFLELWNIFERHKNSPDINTETVYLKKKGKGCVKAFLRENILDGRIAFKILENAAQECLSAQAAVKIEEYGIWSHGLLDRWTLFFLWKSRARNILEQHLKRTQQNYTDVLQQRDNIKLSNNVAMLRCADIFGLTTVGAGKHWDLLQKVGPRVVMVEEAAEVLEGHIVTSLTETVEHLVLIGDHKQLRPNPTVYNLARKYKLDISMFERLLRNNVPSHCLQVQHRMRPCIAELLVPEIYENLQNHPSVLKYEHIKGVARNVYFISHQELEICDNDLLSHSNKHEAHFLVCLCYYLLQQGYEESSITILTTYLGQMRLLRDLMKQKGIKGVHAVTVDNFQGEENDIILLSFVRSNKHDKIGFLEMSNRICVALSRAKSGLYCIGNFELFYDKCSVWRNVIRKLRKMNLISSALPLKCQQHPETITPVSSKHDFEKVVHGGCMKSCTFCLACGHICPLKCHPNSGIQNHNDVLCPEGRKKCLEKNLNSAASEASCVNQSAHTNCKHSKCPESAAAVENPDVVHEGNHEGNTENVACKTAELSVEPDLLHHQDMSDCKEETNTEEKNSDVVPGSISSNKAEASYKKFSSTKSKNEHSVASSTGENFDVNRDALEDQSTMVPCELEQDTKFHSATEVALFSESMPSLSENPCDLLEGELSSAGKQMDHLSILQENPKFFSSDLYLQNSAFGQNCLDSDICEELLSTVNYNNNTIKTPNDIPKGVHCQTAPHESNCFDNEHIRGAENQNLCQNATANQLDIGTLFPAQLPVVCAVTTSTHDNLLSADGENMCSEMPLRNVLKNDCSNQHKVCNILTKEENSNLPGSEIRGTYTFQKVDCEYVLKDQLHPPVESVVCSLLRDDVKDGVFKPEAAKENDSCDNMDDAKNDGKENSTFNLCPKESMIIISSGPAGDVAKQNDSCMDDAENGGRENSTFNLCPKDSLTIISLGPATPVAVEKECLEYKDTNGFQESNSAIDECKDRSCIHSVSNFDATLKILEKMECSDSCSRNIQNKPKENLITDFPQKDTLCIYSSTPEHNTSASAVNVPQHLHKEVNQAFNSNKAVDGNSCLNSAHDQDEMSYLPTRAEVRICDHYVNKFAECEFPVLETLHCGHDILVPCNKTKMKNVCEVEMEVQLPCKHTRFVRCHQSTSATDELCSELVILQMPCGEEVRYVCSEGLQHQNCTSVVLGCGHKVPCTTQTDLYKCEIMVKRSLPCSHEVFIPCYKSFSLNVNCREMISVKPPCGHELQVLCPSKEYSVLDMQEFCRSKCTFLLPCGHECRSADCGKCFKKGKHELCVVPVKKTLPCGHQQEFRCHVEDPVCRSACDIMLSCGHKCPGQCGQCLKFNIHSMCVEAVQRVLPCGHCIQWPCGAPLPVCEERCLFRCEHLRCMNSCQYPCIECKRTCEWKCEHLCCTLPCYAVCNRPPCNVGCPKVLSCGHECAGFCGEPCPKLCIICDDMNSETDVRAKYVLLEDCQHSLTVIELEQYFEKKSNKCCPACPVCGTVITKNRRFGKYIKMWVNNYLHSAAPEHTRKSLLQLSEVCEYYKRWKRTFPHVVDVQKASSNFEAHAVTIIKSKLTPSFFCIAIKMFNNYCVLVHIKALVGKSKLESVGLLRNYKFLCPLLMSYCTSCSVQQAEESSLAVRRLAVLSVIKCSPKKYLHADKFVKTVSLLESKKFGISEYAHVLQLLDDLKRSDAVPDDSKLSCHISTLLDFISDLHAVQESTTLITFDFLKYFCKKY